MIEIIQAIDIIEGKCVRLSQGDYSTKKIYNEDPLEVAKEFEFNGIKRLHLVDLDGAKASHIVNWKVLEKIANNTSLTIDFGGGLKSDHPIRSNYTIKYIYPGLEILPKIQATGDIFFPKRWCSALLGGHNSKESWEEVKKYIINNDTLLPLLKNKLLQSSYHLKNYN